MPPLDSDQSASAKAPDPAATADAKPLSAKPLGYVLAILGGFFTAGPLGLVVSPLALLAIAKAQKWDSQRKPNRFLTWALVGIIGAPVCGAVSFFGGAALMTAFAPKGLESAKGLSPNGESSDDQLLPTMTTIHLKNDSDYPLEKILLTYPGRDKAFEAQQAHTDAHQSSDVLLGNESKDALPCTMEASIVWSDGDQTDLGSLDFCANSNKTLAVRYPSGSGFE
jgi:hypothetical protein